MVLPDANDMGRTDRIATLIGEVRRGNAPEMRKILLQWAWRQHPAWTREFLTNAGLPISIEVPADAALPNKERNADPALVLMRKEAQIIALGRPDRIEAMEVDRFTNEWYWKNLQLIVTREFAERTGSLDLSTNYFERVPDRVQHMIWLESISIADTKIDDLKFLNGMTSLKKLDISACPVMSLRGLEKCTRLEELYMTDCPLRSIAQISALNSLKSLALDDNGDLDLEPILNLNDLESLKIHTNNEDFVAAALRKLPNLRYLSWQPEFTHFIIKDENDNVIDHARTYFTDRWAPLPGQL
jgi:hypothetical protein